MNFDNLLSDNEDLRRFEIIAISRLGSTEAVDYLLGLYESETKENKRHIVRAYRNIGGAKLKDELVNLLSKESGIILGDICKALGQLGVISAKKQIQLLQNHNLQWVSQNANWAIKQFAT